MSTIHQIREELDANRNLAELLDVLKGIAASEFRQLEVRRDRFEHFLDSFAGFFRMVHTARVAHPFLRAQNERIAIIMVTSDEGFMGGLNNRIIHTALAQPGARDAELMVLGERGAELLRGQGLTYAHLASLESDSAEVLARRIRDRAVAAVLEGRVGGVLFVYPQPVSFMVQRVVTEQVLPWTPVEDRDPDPALAAEEMILESDPAAVVEYLVSSWFERKLYEDLEDARLAVLSVRTVQLEQSYQGVREQGTGLRFRFFRARREAVDKEMREAFSAHLIRRKKARDAARAALREGAA